MSTLAVTAAVPEMSPRAKARLAGVFYLLTILLGLFAQGYVSERLVAAGNATATAANIAAHQSLFRFGFAVYLVEMACQITMTVLLYELLKPAGRSVSLVAAVFSIVGCGIKIVSRLFYFAPLLIVGGQPYLSTFTTPQLNTLSLLLLGVNDAGAAIALIFFGLYAILKGYLIFRSTFLPRALAYLSILGGTGWLAFLWPPLGYRFFPVIAGFGLLGAVAFIFWLLVYGVNEERWNAQATASHASIWR